MFRNAFVLHLFIGSLCYFAWVVAQLDGSITSAGDPYVVNVIITNPTANTISLLKWNNIFDDETYLPVSFAVKNDQGNDLRIASTYAMRFGMSNQDLYSIEPQQSFTKNFDLRILLKDLSSGQVGSHLESIHISLPKVVQGITHQGSYTIPPEAAARFSATPPALGNFSAAGLGDITIQAAELHLELQFGVFPPLAGNETPQAVGIRRDTAQCVRAHVNGVSDALADAGIYAHAVQLAAADTSDSGLFRSYFGTASRGTVHNIAGSVAESIRGIGPHVKLYCSDALKLCKVNSNILGYTFTPSWLGNAYVVMCPLALRLGRAPTPCSTPAGTEVSPSSSQVLFHLMLTLNNVVGRVISNSVYGSSASQKLLQASSPGGLVTDPLQNVDSFVQLAVDQWRYGLGGPPYHGAACLPSVGSASTNGKRTVSSRSLVTSEPALTNRGMLKPRQDVDAIMNRVKQPQFQCRGGQQILLQNAEENARALATYARDSRDLDLWKQYICFSSVQCPCAKILFRAFNGNTQVWHLVINIFHRIATWLVRPMSHSFLPKPCHLIPSSGLPPPANNHHHTGTPPATTPAFHSAAIPICAPAYATSAAPPCYSVLLGRSFRSNHSLRQPS